MGKPLKDWTLEEAMVNCIGHVCRSCEFNIALDGEHECRIGNKYPAYWILADNSELTEPELAICRVTGAVRLTRGQNDEYVLLWGSNGEVTAKFVATMFPSVHKGGTIFLSNG